MQTTLLPAGVISSIEKSIRGFLWGNEEGTRKCHLVNWEMVTRSKASRGLGIRDLEKMNGAFLEKLGWRIMQNEDCLWVKLFKAKYTINPEDYTSWWPRGNMSNAWRGILKAVPILQQGIRKLLGMEDTPCSGKISG